MVHRGVLVLLLQISIGLISASCLVRDMTSPRVVYPRVAESASCPVTVAGTLKCDESSAACVRLMMCDCVRCRMKSVTLTLSTMFIGVLTSGNR